MDLPVDKFIEGLLSKDAAHQPSDSVRENEIEISLPPWYDKDKFEKARKFFWKFSFAMSSSMLIGLVAVFSIPSILKVLVHSQRSTTLYTAYKRYLATILHVMSWFENKLEPGSISWKSLTTVRKRHLRAALSAKSLNQGTVSQRDLSLTLFGFMGFTLLKPDQFGIRAMNETDWDDFIHFWRTIGYVIGIEDRYNICRKTVRETREVCQIILQRVYTPCLENVPEYFEHMSKVMIEGLWSVNPTVDTKAILFRCKYLADVPGYLYTEQERIAFQIKLEQALGDKPDITGIPSSSLISEPAVDGLPTPVSQRLHFVRDYDVLENIPAYKCLTGFQKYKLNSIMFTASFYHTNIGRWFYNFNYGYSVWLMKYLPYLGFFRFGIKSSFVNIFVESPKDLTAEPKPNSHYYNRKPMTWIRECIEFYWGER